jgi:hypothetical protein
MYGNLQAIQGDKVIWSRQIRIRTEAMHKMWYIYQLGRQAMPVLRTVREGKSSGDKFQTVEIETYWKNLKNNDKVSSHLHKVRPQRCLWWWHLHEVYNEIMRLLEEKVGGKPEVMHSWVCVWGIKIRSFPALFTYCFRVFLIREHGNARAEAFWA